MSAFQHAAFFEAAPPFFAIRPEQPGDVAAREALLDAAMGPGRTRKSSEALRRGRLPAQGLSLAALAADGTLAGTVRLWAIAAGMRGGAPVPALLLGPLAVDPASHGSGIGGALMRHATAEAARLGHGAILLVGDPEYYGRFGFSTEATGALAMPGPFEQRRLLALELQDGGLAGAAGLVTATGRLKDDVPAREAAA
ncbi:GNAT family N-acetyltransferase [Aurantimonas aggregata]|uniref:GNAT family N-acetyltransferase n=1 Tax=Aurantimonas aggregata TaxID=2047720 RepID=A0A6L9MDE8_9HYPH|nr:N-acetyltransferase [Aurantimonas aggregata]NDV85864.1 GNAT family N-acetyltransferase [Aurantimonas aggregata]